MNYVVLLVLPCLAYLLTWWSTGWSLSPDGTFYLRMAKGERVPSPYARRWFLPLLLGNRPRLWQAWSLTMVVLSAFLTARYVGGSLQNQLLAEMLFFGLPGIWRLNVRLPILVDPTAFCAALGSAMLLQSGHSVLGVLLLMVGSATKETVPLFTAAFSMSLLPLSALVVPLFGHFLAPRNPTPEEVWLKFPIREARKVHDFFEPMAKIAPWGAVVILAFLGSGHPTPAALCALVLGYGQCLLAQDNARLYQWAAPAVLAVVLQNPPSWALAIAFLGLFNPYRGV